MIIYLGTIRLGVCSQSMQDAVGVCLTGSSTLLYIGMYLQNMLRITSTAHMYFPPARIGWMDSVDAQLHARQSFFFFFFFGWFVVSPACRVACREEIPYCMYIPTYAMWEVEYHMKTHLLYFNVLYATTYMMQNGDHNPISTTYQGTYSCDHGIGKFGERERERPAHDHTTRRWVYIYTLEYSWEYIHLYRCSIIGPQIKIPASRHRGGPYGRYHDTIHT